LLSNVALSVLDEYIAQAPGGPAATHNERARRRRLGLPNYRISRYADDWCLMVHGTKTDAEALREEIAGVLLGMGLRLSPEKTLVTHIDKGLVFLGWHIQRQRKRGTNRYYVYTYPSRKAVKAVMAKVKTQCRRTGTDLPLDALLIVLNQMMRGGAPTSDPEYPASPSNTCATTRGVRSSDDYAENTAGSPGRNYAAATAAASGGQPARTGNCSTPPRCAPRATATGAQSSLPHGGPQE
jgi:hypothetical protein